jgi:hypothetical protein
MQRGLRPSILASLCRPADRVIGFHTRQAPSTPHVPACPRQFVRRARTLRRSTCHRGRTRFGGAAKEVATSSSTAEGRPNSPVKLPAASGVRSLPPSVERWADRRELDLKRLETLREAVPKIRRMGALVNPVTASRYAEGVTESARALGLQLQIERVSTPGAIRGALNALKEKGADALLVQDEPMLSRSAPDVAALALMLRLPSISQSPRFAESGGLLQLGADILETFRASARHVDKILRGAKPGDLPIEQPTKIDLIVNLKTAKALGLTLPPSVLVGADRVIE